MAEIKNPQNKIVFADSAQGQYPNFLNNGICCIIITSDNDTINPRHEKGANMTFADGHVDFMEDPHSIKLSKAKHDFYVYPKAE